MLATVKKLQRALVCEPCHRVTGPLEDKKIIQRASTAFTTPSF